MMLKQDSNQKVLQNTNINWMHCMAISLIDNLSEVLEVKMLDIR